MPKIVNNLELGLEESLEDRLQWLEPSYTSFRILRKSVDARGFGSPKLVYTLEVAGPGESLITPRPSVERLTTNLTGNLKHPPIIIGAGPAGLFAALRLVERGIPCRLFERGSKAEARIFGINRFWRYGKLDPRNNVCFGEGGAGLYSDGKLITRIKSPYIPYVLDRLVQFGAPKEITYLANPHVGSDKIRRVIPKLREFLLKSGCEIHFDTQVTELLKQGSQIVGVKTEHGATYRSDQVVMATGHSAEDSLHHLREIGVLLEGKSFAVGLRIEHEQNLINKIQFRDAWNHPALGAANYKLANHDKTSNIGVYSFCMCPGGYVLSSGTAPDGLVCNGMSNFHRSSAFANAAIVVSIDHEKNFGSAGRKADPFAGLEFRKQLETEAYRSVLKAGGTKQLPAQYLGEFFKGTSGRTIAKTSSPSGAQSVRFNSLLPEWISQKIMTSLEKFDRQMKGYLDSNAVLYGMETRTSCPVRVTRHESTLQSLSHSGLYPCGEGAGYAGGISSAACDGVRIAETITAEVSSQHISQ